MSFKVQVQPSGKEFLVDANATILEAALAQGIVIPYGCKNGACGSCKGLVVSGEFEQGAHQRSALPEIERQNGAALFCCARALSDLVIEARVIAAGGDIPLKKLPCRVASLDRKTHDVTVLKLQLPATERFQYKAGQYIEFLLRDGSRRSYSMATAPHLAEQLELHIRHMPGGKFTDTVFGATAPALKERDILRFEGPMGTFFLREDSSKPIVLLASGTGFAPIKALVEQIQYQKISRPVALYWGGRRPLDLYQNELCEQWSREIPNFKYTPVISDALPEDQWQGRTGFVHKAVMQDCPDLSAYQVYACGAPIVISSAQRDFTGLCNLPSDEFFADSFTSAADLASSVA